MKFEIITIFPQIFDSYFSESIIGRARKKGLINISVHNLRDYTVDKHRTVDDTPYGGGPGMVMKVEPIYKCIEKIKSKVEGQMSKVKVILLSAKGKKFSQKEARRLAKYDNLILICGRYEGVDERVAKYIADEEISTGDYVLTGGEIPALVVIDSVTRLLPGSLGNINSLKSESYNKPDYLEYPQYSKPDNYHGWKVPKILLNGNHKKIEEWRRKHSKNK